VLVKDQLKKFTKHVYINGYAKASFQIVKLMKHKSKSNVKFVTIQ
jgi:hypothetical protein